MEQRTSCSDGQRRVWGAAGKGALLYLRQGGSSLLTEVTTRKEGWGGMGGAQHRCGWFFGGFFWVCGMSRGKWVRSTDTDNMEKPGLTVKYPSCSSEGWRLVGFVFWRFRKKKFLKDLIHSNEKKLTFSHFLQKLSSLSFNNFLKILGKRNKKVFSNITGLR